MAIKDYSRKPYTQDNDTNIKIGIDLPVRRDPVSGGFFATTSTTIEAVKNNIKNLLQTQSGERLMRPNFGLNLQRVLFEQITDESLLGIQDLILDQIENWLPFVEVFDIQIYTADSDSVVGSNEVAVKVIFNIKNDPTTLNSVTIEFSPNEVDNEIENI